MEQTGKLMVRVYTSSAQLPVEGATVVVTTHADNGKYDLVSVQKTDRSGEIEPVVFDTPAARNSTDQNTTLRAPFVACDVWAEHPGFAVMRVDGVQIFPGVVTRQDMELIPLGAGDNGLDKVDERNITAQNL